MKATWRKHVLKFDRPRGTSRGWFREKPSYYLILKEGDRLGIGECGLLPGLSIDDRPDYESTLNKLVQSIDADSELPDLSNWPSIHFGFEMAKRHLETGDLNKLFDTDFTRSQAGIKINGLIWMGDRDNMLDQMEEKLQIGFSCVKMKIGAIDFDDELALLRQLRSKFSNEKVQIRVDANGAFQASEALSKMEKLHDLQIHSIEQPIKAGQWNEMKALCQKSPLSIALDEELIGIQGKAKKKELLNSISPDAIVLKPSLLGGWKETSEWIDLASEHGVSWWITSALESDIGLNAIAQFTSQYDSELAQGLGTGKLYLNNIPSPLELRGEELWINPNKNWKFPFFNESI